jgi:NhaP-type Na+/H+ or K+/H+ antiporter
LAAFLLIYGVSLVIYGVVVGRVERSWCTTQILRFAERRNWISEHWEEIPIVALAAACFAAAQAVGGSGFIACFVGGLLLSGPPSAEDVIAAVDMDRITGHRAA